MADCQWEPNRRSAAAALKEMPLVKIPWPVSSMLQCPRSRPLLLRTDENYTWAELMKRVWALDVQECPRCRARMRILADLHSPDAIEKILKCLDLPSRAPPVFTGRTPIRAATQPF